MSVKPLCCFRLTLVPPPLPRASTAGPKHKVSRPARPIGRRSRRSRLALLLLEEEAHDVVEPSAPNVSPVSPLFSLAALFPPPCQDPGRGLRAASLFHNISVSTAMRCEGRQRCSLHLRVGADLRLAGLFSFKSLCWTAFSSKTGFECHVRLTCDGTIWPWQNVI